MPPQSHSFPAVYRIPSVLEKTGHMSAYRAASTSSSTSFFSSKPTGRQFMGAVWPTQRMLIS